MYNLCFCALRLYFSKVLGNVPNFKHVSDLSEVKGTIYMLQVRNLLKYLAQVLIQESISIQDST